MSEKTPLTFEERAVTAFVSTVVAALTIAVVGVGFFLRAAGRDSESWDTFFRVSGILCAGAGVVGFVVGPDRMARHFGFLWGTDKPSTAQAAIGVTVVLAICGVALFGWPKWF